MPAARVRVKEDVWAEASPTRQNEWRLLCAELADHPSLLPGVEAARLVMSCDPSEVELRISSTRETEFGPTPHDETLRASRATLDAVLNEYLDVIRRLDDDGISSMRAEALDMAKKVVHDDAARRFGLLFPEVGDDIEVHRRFFSLFVALAFDTTRLTHTRGHRR